jgi:ABC-2 type transport system permease protein
VIDAITIARKELKELFGERASRRGVFVQAASLALVLGILLPMSMAVAWHAALAVAVVPFLIAPSIIAVAIGADAFAGERERRTLETLLATPLTDRSIVVGKALAAVFASVSVAIAGMIVATVTLSLHGSELFVPQPELWAGAVLGAVSSSCLATALAIFLSLKIPVARSVQQMVSMVYILPVLFGGFIFAKVGFALDSWLHIFVIEAIVFGLGIAGLAVAAALFRRHRLFARR